MQTLDEAVIDAITVSVPKNVASGNNKDWTFAIWEAFAAICEEKRLDLYPTGKPKKGEYLVDFMLFDRSTGPVLACESQLWSPRHSNDEQNLAGIEWAFDKLRGVKANTKVLIFEQKLTDDGRFPAKVHCRLTQYLLNFEHHLMRERFIFIQFEGNRWHVYEWKPKQDGLAMDSDLNFNRIKC